MPGRHPSAMRRSILERSEPEKEDQRKLLFISVPGAPAQFEPCGRFGFGSVLPAEGLAGVDDVGDGKPQFLGCFKPGLAVLDDQLALLGAGALPAVQWVAGEETIFPHGRLDLP